MPLSAPRLRKMMAPSAAARRMTGVGSRARAASKTAARRIASAIGGILLFNSSSVRVDAVQP